MDSILDEFEEQCRQGIFPPITRWLDRIEADKRSQLFVELLTVELHYRRLQGTPQGKEYYIVHYPEYADQVQQAIAADNIDLVATQNFAVKNANASENPTDRIGRFVIQKRLGQGGFGLVYLALDEQLDRLVALKIPRPDLHLDPESAETYVKEAKTLARLDHPHIVPILEVGSTPEHPIYIVSKYIDGCDLGKWMSQAPRSQEQLVQVMLQLADGLKAAHKHGIVHRDIKPQNVLVDRNERVYLVDFGLALRDQDIGKKLPTGGTPGYMSPEQVKGEGHRVDGRSDLFSVGVVFYEMLTGRRPFPGSTQLVLFEQIKELDPKPPRQWNESIDRELERVCLKLLAKRKSDRYSSAQDLIEDLDAFLKRNASTQSQSIPVVPSVRQTPIASDTENDKEKETPVAVTPGSGSSVLKIVPKGLRSFDQQDADFFLELLPGPRDRNGLPDTIAFWKARIEERDADKTFNVGLVYGPSGCGKSSMMKAGLIPRLTKNVVAIYLEATTDQTEGALLYQLRKRLDSEHISYPESTNLLDLLTVIRRGKVLPSNKKLLIVLDQFEQWLYAHTVANGTELLDALLQCDGSRLQAIVMVRDDFWMAATRFFRDLDIQLVEGHNSAAVDLFDIDHATRVLKAFGRAFGKLDVDGAEDKQDRKQFVTDAVQGLAEDNKVISVRLSLFAEMMKGRQWTPESLNEVGGTAGIGATFLEETFSASGAPPEHRYHQSAARAVLRSLLPDGGTEIKGHRRSREELLEASGYSGRTRDFQDLIRILDSELRLITPVDSTETQAPAATNEPFEVTETRLAPAARVDYQLTHDYLVPSLRDWLTRKQRETKKGRAELKLAERATVWSAKQESKQLPTLWEWINIRRWTDKRRWTASEKTLMRKAARVHFKNWGSSILVILILGGVIGYLFQQQSLRSQQEKITVALDSLEKTLGPAVPVNIDKLIEMNRPDLIRPELERRYAAAKESREKLSLAFALARFGQVDSAYMVSQIDSIEDRDTGNLATALGHDSAGSIEKLRQAASECITSELHRRKARLALAAMAIGDTTLPIDACEFEGRTDHGIRTWFIDEFRRWELDREALVASVKDAVSPALRSAVCLGLGQIAVKQISAEDKTRIAELATKWYSLTDSSTHSASAWLLRQWELPEPTVSNATQMVEGRNWFVNSQGVTYVRITPPSMKLAAVRSDVPEQPYWIANREVTRGEFQAFLNDTIYAGAKPTDRKEASPDDSVSPTLDHPAHNVSWYDAVMYCNWLSSREGRKPAYRYLGKEKIKEFDDEEVEVDKWEVEESADGYRLPREVEWEYACRAETTTAWSPGNDESLLSAYCQMSPSKLTAVCGEKLPNAWGLHDMHGNVYEWCWDLYDQHGSYRVNRGGSWNLDAAYCESAFRYRFMPLDRDDIDGFRLALSRSGIPGPPEATRK